MDLQVFFSLFGETIQYVCYEQQLSLMHILIIFRWNSKTRITFIILCILLSRLCKSGSGLNCFALYFRWDVILVLNHCVANLMLRGKLPFLRHPYFDYVWDLYMCICTHGTILIDMIMILICLMVRRYLIVIVEGVDQRSCCLLEKSGSLH